MNGPKYLEQLLCASHGVTNERLSTKGEKHINVDIFWPNNFIFGSIAEEDAMKYKKKSFLHKDVL